MRQLAWIFCIRFATDRDEGYLKYSIISGDSRGDFTIDENIGTIKVNKQLDYEKTQRL